MVVIVSAPVFLPTQAGPFHQTCDGLRLVLSAPVNDSCPTPQPGFLSTVCEAHLCVLLLLGKTATERRPS